MLVLFACRRSRTGDIGVLRLGVAAAGHRFRLMLLPWAYPLLLLAALARVCGVPMHLILSDKFIGDTLVARLFGSHCTRMLWNFADEWPARTTQLPRHKVCFFPEEGQHTEIFRFAPQPVLLEAQPRPAERRSIVFLGDVTRALPVPRGAAWWEERFASLQLAHGYTFYLHPEYRELLDRELPRVADRRYVKVLAKNLLRWWIVRDVREQFGERLVLIGSNWRRLGLAAEPSAYEVQTRTTYYRSAIVNLDCGSKSGDGALYPRSSELLSYAGGLLQVHCEDSRQLFEAAWPECSFDGRAMLMDQMEQRLSEPLSRRAERDERVIGQLRARRLLMQHSVDGLLQSARESHAAP